MTEIKCILYLSMMTGFQIFHCVIHVKTLENIICFFFKENTKHHQQKQKTKPPPANKTSNL